VSLIDTRDGFAVHRRIAPVADVWTTFALVSAYRAGASWKLVRSVLSTGDSRVEATGGSLLRAELVAIAS
jgi:hypothetical protein